MENMGMPLKLCLIRYFSFVLVVHKSNWKSCTVFKISMLVKSFDALIATLAMIYKIQLELGASHLYRQNIVASIFYSFRKSVNKIERRVIKLSWYYTPIAYNVNQPIQLSVIADQVFREHQKYSNVSFNFS